MTQTFAAIAQSEVFLYGLMILLSFLGLFVFFLVVWWLDRQPDSKSPYTGGALRQADTLAYYSKEKVLRFLFDYHQYDNRIFDLKRAAFCRDTGRIFPNCITWYEKIRLDWSFIQKRYPGRYISWGSLTSDVQREIREEHHSLEGFQTEFSCPFPSPRAITPEYAWAKPGPLYVDLETRTLLGWVEVPGTELEVLIVQKPIKTIIRV